MFQSTRLVNSLYSPEISHFLIRTPPHCLLSRTAKPLASARLELISRAAISSRASGGDQIDPIKPLVMNPDSTERLGINAIEDPAHDFVTVDHPVDETLPPAESLVADSRSLGSVDGIESGDVAVEGGEEHPRTDFEEDSEGHRVEYLDTEGRPVLPDELLKSVVVLTCESADGRPCDVFLIGTAHVSEESCREVREVISFIKPQVVFLELCASRVAVLTLQDLKVPTMNEMIDMWKKKQNLFGILYSWFLAKVADKLEVLPGAEFRVGFEEAREWGSKVILGDRPVNVTLRRTWGKMPLWHKTKLLYSFLFQAFFLPSPEDLNKMLMEMNDNDMLTLVVQEMSKQFPTLMETLVDERDQYMASTLLRVASYHHTVVAVVGKGHLRGIKKYWLQPIDVDKLMEIPSTRASTSPTKMFMSLGVAVVGVAIVTGIFFAVKKQS